MIRATDMILAAQRTVYDGSNLVHYTPTAIHTGDVACQVRDTLETRRQNDNPHYVEHLDYKVSTCTVRQEVRKLREMVKRGRGYGPNAYKHYNAAEQAFARKLACAGSFYQAR